MHIFFLDLFTDIDALSPIIYKLNQDKKNNVMICSTNYIQNNENNELIKYFKKEGIIYLNFPHNKYLFILFKIIKNILKKLPRNLLNKSRFLFKFLYYNFTFFSKDDIKDLLKKYKIKSVSVDSSNPISKLEKISNACKDLKIKLIFIPSGAEILNINAFNTKEDFKLCSYYLSQNTLEKFKIPEETKEEKIKFLGSPRFSDEWISFLNKFYNKKFSKKNSNPNIGIFVTPAGQNFSKHEKIVRKLLNDNYLNTEIRHKPRDYMLEKCCDFNYDFLNTNELINWSDIIVTVQTSLIIEAIKKNKHVMFLEYYIPDEYGSWIDKYNCVDRIKSEQEILHKIELIKQNKYNFEIQNKNEYLVKVVGEESENNNILRKYVEFYSKIS